MATSTDTVNVSAFTLGEKQWLVRLSPSLPAGVYDGKVAVLIGSSATLPHFDVTAGTLASYF
jgi:hypothetical protein